MIAEHADDRDVDRRQVFREDARFVGEAVVREVAAQHEHVGRLGDLSEQRLQAALRGLRVVDVGERSQPDDVRGVCHGHGALYGTFRATAAAEVR